MVVKVKEKFETTKHIKNFDKSKKYILWGQRNVRFYDRILSIKKKFYNFTTASVQKGKRHQSQRISHGLRRINSN